MYMDLLDQLKLKDTENTMADDDSPCNEPPFGLKIGAVFSLVSDENKKTDEGESPPKVSPCSVNLRDIFEHKSLKGYKNRVRTECDSESEEKCARKSNDSSPVQCKQEPIDEETDKDSSLDQENYTTQPTRPQRKRKLNKMFSEGSEYYEDYRFHYAKRKKFYKDYHEIISSFQRKYKMKELLRQLEEQNELDLKHSPYRNARKIVREESDEEGSLDKNRLTEKATSQRKQTARTKKKLWKCNPETSEQAKNVNIEKSALPPKLEPAYLSEYSDSIPFPSTVDNNPPVLEHYNESCKQIRKNFQEPVSRIPCSLSGRCHKPNPLYNKKEFELNMKNVKKSSDKKKIAEVKPMRETQIEIKKEVPDPPVLEGTSTTEKCQRTIERHNYNRESDSFSNEYSSMLSETFKNLPTDDLFGQTKKPEKQIKTEKSEVKPPVIDIKKDSKGQTFGFNHAIQELARKQNTNKFFQLMVGGKIVLIPTDGGTVIPKAFVMDATSVSAPKSEASGTVKQANCSPSQVVTTASTQSRPQVHSAVSRLPQPQVSIRPTVSMQVQPGVTHTKQLPRIVLSTSQPQVTQNYSSVLPRGTVAIPRQQPHPIKIVTSEELARLQAAKDHSYLNSRSGNKTILTYTTSGVNVPVVCGVNRPVTSLLIQRQSQTPQTVQTLRLSKQPEQHETGIYSTEKKYNVSETRSKMPMSSLSVKTNAFPASAKKQSEPNKGGNKPSTNYIPNPIPNEVPIRIKQEVDLGDYGDSSYRTDEHTTQQNDQFRSDLETNIEPSTSFTVKVKSEKDDFQYYTQHVQSPGRETETEERIRKLKEKLKMQQKMVEDLRKNMNIESKDDQSA